MIQYVKGSHPWALILCYASDQFAPTWPGPDYLNTLIASPAGNGLYTWWQQVSNGNLDLEGSKVFGWYPLPHTVAEIQMWKRRTLVANACDAAKSAGIDLSGYRHTLALVTGYSDSGNIDSDISAGFIPMNCQQFWRWCRKCQSMAFWDGSRNPGTCPARGVHDHSTSGEYLLPHDTTVLTPDPRWVSTPYIESGWRWCYLCEGLIYYPNTSTPAGPCAGGRNHLFDLRNANYVLRKDSPLVPMNEQQPWHRCKNCQALSFGPGACPGPGNGGVHDLTDPSNYSIPQNRVTLGFFAHESGHAFGLSHAFGTDRTGDLFNDSRPGAYGDWTDIMSWEKTAWFVVPFFNHAGAGLNAPTLYKIGWIPGMYPATVIAPDSVKSFTLKPLYSGLSQSLPGSHFMIRVIDPARGWIYTAEYRVPVGWDQGIKPGRVVIHAMRTLYQAGQQGWRRCTSCNGLIYAGQTVCPAGGVHNGSNSSDYSVLINTGSSQGQSHWRCCKKCCGLFNTGFFAGNAPQGNCPAGGYHDGSDSADYIAVGDQPMKKCNKCQGLAFAGNSIPGVCPAGGLHNHIGSDNYAVIGPNNPFLLFPNKQNKWRLCSKCQSLYYAGLGACKGGDIHNFIDNDYAPVHDLVRAIGQPGWRYCGKCYGMAFNDGSGHLGICAASGPHDYSTSGEYVIPSDAEAESGERNWHWCRNCSALNYVDPVRGPGLCSVGGKHINGDTNGGDTEYLIAHDTDITSGTKEFHWCRNCENMVLGKNPDGCIKANGGQHATTSRFYVVRTDPASLIREQAWWRTCTKCNTLFAMADTDATKQKPCAVGGSHSPVGEYFLTFVTDNPFWRWCGKCQSMAFWTGLGNPGPCPASGVHDHSASAFYIPPEFTLDVTQVVNDNLVAGQNWTDPSNRVRFDILEMDAKSATVQVTTPHNPLTLPPTRVLPKI